MAILSNVNRRELLTSAATITVAGVAPNIAHNEPAAKSEVAQSATALALPNSEWPAQTLSPVTALRVREIAKRNRIRKEAGLPPLSVPQELRRMKEAADTEKFRKFADAHRKSVHDEMLSEVRRRCGDSAWTPTGVFSGGGLWFAAQVDEEIRRLYRRMLHRHSMAAAAVVATRPDAVADSR